ncbi:MAG: TylF/MycF/NovP-related O-methyltransferase [Phycisphaerales bacterium]|jgi:hypothetical protein
MSKEQIIEKVKHAGLVTLPVYDNTYDSTVRVLREGVPGCLMECGVYAGAQVAVMAQAQMDEGHERPLHLFDSFEGIPEAGPRDDDQPGIGYIAPEDRHGRLISSGISACDANQVLSNLREWGVPLGLVTLHVGWFQDTVRYWDGSPIALLRLDGDLYESTKVCLEHLYPHLSPGGILIVDDYTLTGCHAAVVEYFGATMPRFYEVSDGNGCHWAVKEAAA